jgi:phosphatidylglycerophosphate synthase
VARELFMIVLSEVALRRGVADIRVNMLGRWAVWPTMFSMFLAMVSVTWVADALLYLGLAMTLGATALYVRDGLRALRGQSSQS